jgi:hypothetical protein
MAFRVFIFFYILMMALSFCTIAQIEVRVGRTITCGLDSTIEINSYKNGLLLESKINSSSARSEDITPKFEVKYSGFTPEAQTAFQFAVDIWERTIQSDVKIRIFANWAFLDNVSTLAFVTPTEVKNFENAPIVDLWYPIALAEKLSRKDINPITEADIVATFNSRRDDWYFGTDGNCPSNKLDLVTVVLHELGHGLGFSGTARVSNSNGFYGLSDGKPKIYDTYLKNGVGQDLLSFANGSAALAAQITSNSVVFNSPLAKLLSSTTANPRIYAPNPYEGGSSISHLDQGSYTGTPNSLMTPFAEFGKVAHDCGPLVRGMFYEMGWINTFLIHSAIKDKEVLDEKEFKLGILSDTVVQSSSIKLRYSFDNFSTSSETLLSPSADANYFEGGIVSPPAETTIRYYFEVKDILNRTYKYPINGQSLSFYFGIDTKKPLISHTSPSEIVQFEPTLDFKATVTDNIGLNKVILEYKVNEGELFNVNMVSTAGNDFQASLDLLPLGLNQGDIIQYRIKATDISSQTNEAQFPATGFLSVSVKTFPVREVYISTLNTDQKEFFGDFKISTPVGFSNGAIHSTHPYGKATDVIGIDKTYTLLYPIKLKDRDSFIDFDEVVLVEPGTGNDYTTEEFGDYVIVEGSSNNGQSWTPIIPGYDSRKFPEWLTYYTSDIKDGDSKAIGTLNYFKHNQINLLSTFSSGSEIYIRFRLYANNTKSGWGWAIDNLKIQDIVLSAKDFVANEGVVYPNPIKGNILYVSPSFSTGKISFYNTIGELLKTEHCHECLDINISDLSNGLYVVVGENSQTKSVQKIIIAR